MGCRNYYILMDFAGCLCDLSFETDLSEVKFIWFLHSVNFFFCSIIKDPVVEKQWQTCFRKMVVNVTFLHMWDFSYCMKKNIIRILCPLSTLSRTVSQNIEQPPVMEHLQPLMASCFIGWLLSPTAISRFFLPWLISILDFSSSFLVL